ncbi:MAG: alcohol dehydrogenase catalytic domain-containing protein [Planctomycetes bacterium]|nr:alcohol dehydrogenase catalytic domain-containing protein [Planctomycetota bacterium]
MTKLTEIPKTQYAVEIIGPDKLRLNKAKAIFTPGARQILARVEAVGLCFSDLKLLHQFADHPRKSEIVRGMPPETLAEIPSYVPGEKPTVPGHEVVCLIVAVGADVRHHGVGQRVLIQADYRQLETAEANAAFGYNFEGGLQEYVLLDERIMIDSATGQRYLIDADAGLSASAVALVEPWACVENSYAVLPRRTIKPQGRLLVVAEKGFSVEGLTESFSSAGGPAAVTAICADNAQARAVQAMGVPVTFANNAGELENDAFDDIVYFGCDKDGIDALNDKLATKGIFNIVMAGIKIGRPISVGVGRLHYRGTSWIGTLSTSAAEAYKTVPASGELRQHDRVLVVGAGGPMGQMHAIRAICSGLDGLSVTATDFDDSRLASLGQKAWPLAKKAGCALRIVNPNTAPLAEKFTYIALMAPLGELVAQAISDSDHGAMINVFAGIPIATRFDLDMDSYIAKGCYMFGASGSRIEDMKTVLEKVTAGQLDTNRSVEAVCGMAGAADGIAAVKNRTIAGKIIVYPSLHDVPLIELSELAHHYPTVAEKLEDGAWTKAAEKELLTAAARS